jgi:hypothetical protein
MNAVIYLASIFSYPLISDDATYDLNIISILTMCRNFPPVSLFWIIV